MTRMRRAWIWMAMIGSGTTLYQATTTTGVTFGDPAATGWLGTTGCSRFVSSQLVTSIDFCYLLDCNNGFLGGVIDPCGSANSALDDFLADCSPGSTAVNSTAGTTTTGTTTTGSTTTNQTTQTTTTGGFGS